MKTIATAVLGSLTMGSVSAILGGDIVPPGKSSYTSYLSTSQGGNPVCSAVLIDPTHILTGASCLIYRNVTYATVGAQTINGSVDADVLKVVKKELHPDYYGPNQTYDFAVLTLEKESKFSPAKLPVADDSTQAVMTGDSATAFGWGSANSSDFFAYADHLRSVELPLWNNDACIEATGFGFLETPFMCAGGVEGKGLMFYDNGGPLVLQNKPSVGDDTVIGLCSYAREADKGQPSVFSRVSVGVSWIKSQL